MYYFVLNKPPGCITARVDFAGRPTVYDHIPPHFPRLPHVGRLDFNTEGLLLFTDDGRLGQAMINRSFSGEADPGEAEPLDKDYHVKVRGVLAPDDPAVKLLAEPLRYRTGFVTTPARVTFLEHRSRATWLSVVIHDGRHHQVRMLCERSGLQVVKLRRVRLGPLELHDLRVRWCRQLTDDDVAACYQAALPRDPRAPYERFDDSGEAYARARATRDD